MSATTTRMGREQPPDRAGAPAPIGTWSMARAPTTLWLVAMLTVAASPLRAQTPADSLSLEEALAVARRWSPALAAARARGEAASQLTAVARSRRGTRFSADGAYLRYQNPPVTEFGSLGSYAPLKNDNLFLFVSASQPLYTGGRLGSAIRAAEKDRDAALLDARQAEVDLTAAVAGAHNDALLARAQVDVLREAVHTLREAVRVAREHYAEGTVARLDVLRAENRLFTAETDLRAAVARSRTALEALAGLVGLPPDSAPPVAGTLEYRPVHFELDGSTERVLADRPELKALEAAARAREAVAAVARAKRRPTASLAAGVLTTRPEFLTGNDAWSADLLASITVSWSIFDWGESRAEERASEAAARTLRARSSAVRDSLSVRLRAAQRELERTAQDITGYEATVDRAEQALAIAQDRYREGLGIQLDVLEAETDLRRARAGRLSAVHAHRAAVLELKRILGVVADAPLPEVEKEGGK